jgi:hypothetical protein
MNYRTRTVYYDRFIATDRTLPNNGPDELMRDRIVREAYKIDVSFPNSHIFYSS